MGEPMPWEQVAGFLAAILGCVLLAARLGGPLLIMPTLGGVLMGMMGTMQGGTRHAAGGGILVMGLAALHVALPHWTDPRLLALVPAALAGVETGRWGGRAFVIALMTMAIMIFGLERGPDPRQALAAYGLAFAVALPLARLVRLHWRERHPPAGIAAGRYQAAFLAVGLCIAYSLADDLKSSHAVWCVVLFVMRALATVQMARTSARKFALGILMGVAAALGLEALGVAAADWHFAVALAAGVAGLRTMTMGPPWPAALLTLAVLMAIAPEPGSAILRGALGLFATGLAILLNTVLRPLILGRVEE